MGAGGLKDRVLFQARETVDDGKGNEVGAFVDRFTRAAEITPKFGGEAVLAARLAGRQTYLVVVRDCAQTAAVDTDWRAVNARKPSQIFNIRSNAALVDRPGYREMLMEDGVAT